MAYQKQLPTKTHSLYGGKITIDFYEGRHMYKVRETGEVPISVTGATGMLDKSRPLMIWAERLSVEFLVSKINEKIKITEELVREACHLHQVRKEEAATIGGLVHKWAEDYINGEDPEMPTDEKVLNGVTAFLNFVAEHDVQFLASEEIIYSKKHRYVGLFDAIVSLKWNGNKKRTIHMGDFKTNNWKEDKTTGERKPTVYNEYRYQVAAYQNAYEEEHGKYFTGGRLVFSFDKDNGEFHVTELDENPTDYKKDVECFLAALTLKKRDKEMSKF